MSAGAKTVGVMGGLGPAATSDFFARLLAATNAERDQDHLRVLIDCDPRIADRNAAIAGRGPSPGPALAQMARGLEQSGAEFIVLVCNAAHNWERDIRAAITIPFLSMIDETVAATLALEPRPRRVGLLAADACLQADLYAPAFARHDVECAQLDVTDQIQFMELLYRIKSGDRGDEMRRAMRTLALTLARDCDVIVAGCTEVPLVLAAADSAVPLVSSTDVLVARTLEFARGGIRADQPARSPRKNM